MNNKITMGLVGAAIAAMAVAPSFRDDAEKKINVSKDMKNDAQTNDVNKSEENKTSTASLSDDLMKEYKGQIESLLDKKTNSMTVSENISTLTDAYSMEEAESIAQTIYRELNLAQSADSVSTGGGYYLDSRGAQHTGTWCHGACHGACHSACHGSRGWR